jgi:hypothetical protein
VHVNNAVAGARVVHSRGFIHSMPVTPGVPPAG